jgi:hypothetical protein
VGEVVEERQTVEGAEIAETENDIEEILTGWRCFFSFSLLYFLKVAFFAGYVYPSFLFPDEFPLAINANSLRAMKTGMQVLL